MTVDQVDQILIWVALAFCIWLVLSELIRRLQVPSPVLVAATLSWIVARLFIWAIPLILHEVGSWSIR
jgi:hypothetical protein